MDYPIFYQITISVRLFRAAPFSEPHYVAELLVSIDRAVVEQELGKAEWKDYEAVSAGAFAASRACGEIVSRRAKMTHQDVQQFGAPAQVLITTDTLKALPVVSEAKGIVVRLISEKTA